MVEVTCTATFCRYWEDGKCTSSKVDITFDGWEFVCETSEKKES